MILSDSKIKEYQSKGVLFIEDFDEKQLNPNSYNLRLMNKLLVYDCDVIDARKDNPVKEIIIPEDGYVLQPGKVYIGSTIEYTETHPPLLSRVDGRSSIGRLGVLVHFTAGFIDSGFCGKITLEIGCMQPVRIYPNMEICQIEFELVEGDIEKPYCGKYQGQDEPVASRMYKDLTDTDTEEIKLNTSPKKVSDAIIFGAYNRIVPTSSPIISSDKDNLETALYNHIKGFKSDNISSDAFDRLLEVRIRMLMDIIEARVVDIIKSLNVGVLNHYIYFSFYSELVAYITNIEKVYSRYASFRNMIIRKINDPGFELKVTKRALRDINMKSYIKVDGKDEI